VTLPYHVRLGCLCFATFFLLHLALGLLASLTAPYTIRRLALSPARGTAQLLLVLRMLPAGLAGFVVAAVCIPSYLWLEPAGATEEVGWGCLIAAAFGVGVLVESVVRATYAWRRSNRFLRECAFGSVESHAGNQHTTVLLIDGPLPVALAGIVQPRILIARRVAQMLTAAELEVVLGHEQAHRISRDNLKRLLIAFSPDLFPFVRGFHALERAWALAAEWAADERACAGDRRNAFALASALVRGRG